MQPRSVTDILRNTIPDLFELSAPDREVLALESRDRELPKICIILDLDPSTLKPREQEVKNVRSVWNG